MFCFLRLLLMRKLEMQSARPRHLPQDETAVGSLGEPLASRQQLSGTRPPVQLYPTGSDPALLAPASGRIRLYQQELEEPS